MRRSGCQELPTGSRLHTVSGTLRSFVQPADRHGTAHLSGSSREVNGPATVSRERISRRQASLACTQSRCCCCQSRNAPVPGHVECNCARTAMGRASCLGSSCLTITGSLVGSRTSRSDHVSRAACLALICQCKNSVRVCMNHSGLSSQGKCPPPGCTANSVARRLTPHQARVVEPRERRNSTTLVLLPRGSRWADPPTTAAGPVNSGAGRPWEIRQVLIRRGASGPSASRP